MSLALIAGEGALPGLLIKKLEAEERAFRICELKNHPAEGRGDRPAIRFRVETLGSLIAELKGYGVTEVCLAGRIARPKLDPSAIDAATMPLVPRMMAALQAGDDAALRLVLGFFEEAGIAPVAAHDILPELFPEPGVVGEHRPSDQDKADAARGVEIIGAMASVDVGQACVVAKGQALAVEAMGGTDWMLRSLLVVPGGVGQRLMQNETSWDDPLGVAADWLTGTGMASAAGSAVRDPQFPEGGVLVKAAKTGQDRRVDMPTIGVQTVLAARIAGLNGIVIEAGSVMVIDLNHCVEIADQAGMFLWVRE